MRFKITLQDSDNIKVQNWLVYAFKFDTDVFSSNVNLVINSLLRILEKSSNDFFIFFNITYVLQN